MEKKTTRRLIGVLVVVALVIILLPLMFNNNDATGPQQVAQNTTEMGNQALPDPTADDNKLTKSDTAENKISSTPTINETATDAVKPEATVASKTTSTADKKIVTAKARDTKNKTVASTKNVAHDAIVDSLNKETNDFDVASNGEATAKSGNADATTINKNDHNTAKTLAAANQGGWVVQVGSFRNETNVKHLLKQLSEKGYHPFTYPTKSNGQTRVYIGPEFQRDAANKLADKIANDIKIHGVVLSYRPTTA